MAGLKGRLGEDGAEIVTPLWDWGMVMTFNVVKQLRQAKRPEDTYVYWHN